MASAAERQRADRTITMRLAAPTRDLIDRAAAVEGKSRTEFVIESARRHATDVLLDQRIFTLDAAQFDAFLDVLDNPPEPGPALKALLRTPAPWE